MARAEAWILRDFALEPGATVFGAPPTVFATSADDGAITDELQAAGAKMLEDHAAAAKQRAAAGGDEKASGAPPAADGAAVDVELAVSPADGDGGGGVVQGESTTGRMQDVGGAFFYTYVSLTLLLQGMLPVVIALSYGGFYVLFRWVLLEHVGVPDGVALVVLLIPLM